MSCANSSHRNLSSSPLRSLSSTLSILIISQRLSGYQQWILLPSHRSGRLFVFLSQPFIFSFTVILFVDMGNRRFQIKHARCLSPQPFLSLLIFPPLVIDATGHRLTVFPITSTTKTIIVPHSMLIKIRLAILILEYICWNTS
jgi:hypothetical protein